MTELERFLALWDAEAEKTASLMRALPADQYDFRPDAGGRSIGELAWHLAEGDAYNSLGVESGGIDPGMKPPGIARPRTIAELAPGYERIHADAKERIRKLRPEDLERKIKYFDGNEMAVIDILWNGLLLHLVHHCGQLAMLCRLAGGASPGMYGPNREEMAALRGRGRKIAAGSCLCFWGAVKEPRHARGNCDSYRYHGLSVLEVGTTPS